MFKILLTGGSGFIGKNILESFLAKKYQIIAPTRTQLDLSVQESVDTFFKHHPFFDVVIHAAVKPGHRNALDHNNLLSSHLRMFHYLVRHKEKFNKFINLGSGAIYAINHYQAQMKEDYAGTYIPLDDHGLAKYTISGWINQLNNFVDLRIFGIFGKYEDYAIRFISNAIAKSLLGMPITLRQNRRFHYLWIDDLMPILDFFITANFKHKAYNITPNLSVELLELAHLVVKIANKPVDIIVAEQGLGLEYTGDNFLLKQELKQLKFTPLIKSVESLYAWYAQQTKELDINKLIIDK
jgi:UDP-glucose 4-epimerase